MRDSVTIEREINEVKNRIKSPYRYHDWVGRGSNAAEDEKLYVSDNRARLADLEKELDRALAEEAAERLEDLHRQSIEVEHRRMQERRNEMHAKDMGIAIRQLREFQEAALERRRALVDGIAELEELCRDFGEAIALPRNLMDSFAERCRRRFDGLNPSIPSFEKTREEERRITRHIESRDREQVENACSFVLENTKKIELLNSMVLDSKVAVVSECRRLFPLEDEPQVPSIPVVPRADVMEAYSRQEGYFRSRKFVEEAIQRQDQQASLKSLGCLLMLAFPAVVVGTFVALKIMESSGLISTDTGVVWWVVGFLFGGVLGVIGLVLCGLDE